MAVTKIKAIKSTLDKAIKYICNPQKTQGGMLIDSSGCVPEFAARQMEATAEKNKRGGCRKAYHLMQSFAPDDDLAPEQALEIGRKFADQVTMGIHQYVISVHTDCDHIHCHIIFNAVDSTPDHLKYRYQGYSERDRIRDISDQLCRDNGLSVLPRWTKGKGHGHDKHIQHQKSWRDRLGDAIDRAILTSGTYEEFITAMEVEEGYTFRSGKHIAFLAEGEGQKKYTRCDSIGEDYTEDMIRDRIANKESYKDIDAFSRGKMKRKIKDHSPDIQEKDGRAIPVPEASNGTAPPSDKSGRTGKRVQDSTEGAPPPDRDPGPRKGRYSRAGRDAAPEDSRKKSRVRADREIGRISDLSQNAKAQGSPGYKHAAEKNNLNMLVKTMEYLVGHDIETPERFRAYYGSCHDKVNELNGEIQETELAMADLKERRYHIRTYFRYLKFYNTFLKYKDMGYHSQHKKELQEFELSKMWLERNGIDPRQYRAQEYQEEYARLKEKKDALYEEIGPAKARLYDARDAMENVRSVLGIDLYGSGAQEDGGAPGQGHDPDRKADIQRDDKRAR